MSGPSPDVPEFAARFEAAEPRMRLGARVVAGALIAAVASGALAWWLSSDDRGRMTAQGDTQPAVVEPQSRIAPIRASTAADPAQVRRAYDEVRSVYADGGAPALARFAQECSATLASDPRILDYCVSFDMYAAALAPSEGEAAQWFQVGEARRLRLARAALPQGADAEARLAEIGQLMRAATRAPDAPQPVAAPAAVTPAPTQRTAAPVKAAAPPVQRIAAKAPPRKAAGPKANPRCRFAPTPAERLLCANPSLQAADRRLQRAYSRAIAAGADREVIDGEQAAWRTARNGAANRREMAQLYARRMAELARHADSAN